MTPVALMTGRRDGRDSRAATRQIRSPNSSSVGRVVTSPLRMAERSCSSTVRIHSVTEEGA